MRATTEVGGAMRTALLTDVGCRSFRHRWSLPMRRKSNVGFGLDVGRVDGTAASIVRPATNWTCFCHIARSRTGSSRI